MSCESHWEENVSLADGNKWRPTLDPNPYFVYESLCVQGEAVFFLCSGVPFVDLLNW